MLHDKANSLCSNSVEELLALLSTCWISRESNVRTTNPADDSKTGVWLPRPAASNPDELRLESILRNRTQLLLQSSEKWCNHYEESGHRSHFVGKRARLPPSTPPPPPRTRKRMNRSSRRCFRSSDPAPTLAAGWSARVSRRRHRRRILLRMRRRATAATTRSPSPPPSAGPRPRHRWATSPRILP